MACLLFLHVDVAAKIWSPVAIIKHPLPNMCALTFDDGPSPLTPKVLDALKEAGIPATFFVLGRQVVQRPEMIRRMVAEGHEVANHSYSHPDLIYLSKEGIRRELGSVNKLLNDLGVVPRFMRPPYGSYNGKVVALTKELGMELMMWSTDSRDWQRQPDYSNMPNSLGRLMQPDEMRGIFLFHDIQRRTVRDIGLIIVTLKAMGCEHFVTVSEYVDAVPEVIMTADTFVTDIAPETGEMTRYSSVSAAQTPVVTVPEALVPVMGQPAVVVPVQASPPMATQKTPFGSGTTPPRSMPEPVPEPAPETVQLVEDEESYLNGGAGSYVSPFVPLVLEPPYDLVDLTSVHRKGYHMSIFPEEFRLDIVCEESVSHQSTGSLTSHVTHDSVMNNNFGMPVMSHVVPYAMGHNNVHHKGDKIGLLKFPMTERAWGVVIP